MVYFEIKRWLVTNKAAKKLSAFEELYSHSGIDSMDKEVLEITVAVYVKLREQGITIGDADILIASYCIKNNITLITNNIQHFEVIEQLQVVNW